MANRLRDITRILRNIAIVLALCLLTTVGHAQTTLETAFDSVFTKAN